MLLDDGKESVYFILFCFYFYQLQIFQNTKYQVYTHLIGLET